MTLLSPARDISVAKAAIQAGADAVYIGAPRFGARQAAGNSLDDLQALVQYAHTYGVQVLVTLNTLLREEEYAEAVEMAWALYHIGIDALIIQDLRLLTFRLPPIRLHASTQCDNRTAEQVIRLQELGFRRVVLARELSISEIRAIRDAVVAHSEAQGQQPIELEAFVHGALCVSYSGRCYMSEVLTGRSANRGACAQMCRMQYDLLDANGQELTDDQGKPIHQRYLLSLQDMDRSAHLQELIDAGVTTFKIEGRLKDADYVTNITAYYRQKLDALPSLNSKLSTLNSPLSTIHYSFSPNPAKTFHRGGIDYFLHGRTAHMANWETPKSTGEYIGQVAAIRNGKIRLTLQDGIALHNGDGLCFGDQGFSVNGVEGDWILPNALPKDLRAGDKVFRNLDTAFVKSLRCERRIPVDILFAETDDGFRLRIGDTEKQFAYAHEPAKNPERALQTLREQLTKLGDTPYAVRQLTLNTRPYFIPISVLNAWRREVIENGIHWGRGRLARGNVSECVPTRRGTQGGAVSNNSPAPLAGRGIGGGVYQRDAVSMPSPIEARENVTNNHSFGGATPENVINFRPHLIESPTFNNQPSSSPLMTCRYCLLHEMGHCRKVAPLKNEPRYLSLRNGTILRLHFDCQRCEMLIMKD
ncbi:MAG: U32 family peptidase [Paludibacteraceae bacterium]|nr:U32 family peptidase [Paludibacteraceae bacterium]